MARGTRRRKQSVADKAAAKNPKDGNPKSMVIRIGAGEVGTSVSQLVTDVRHVMEPDTAVRLKVQHSTLLSLVEALLMCHAGTTSQQAERLRDDVRSPWRHSSSSILPFRVR